MCYIKFNILAKETTGNTILGNAKQRFNDNTSQQKWLGKVIWPFHSKCVRSQKASPMRICCSSRQLNSTECFESKIFGFTSFIKLAEHLFCLIFIYFTLPGIFSIILNEEIESYEL